MTENRDLSHFLLIIAAMVLIMAVIGAATRLTESGLSITYWKPFTGAIPPITEMDWQAEFETYQTSPQYQQVNKGMTIEEFKTIFWWEWVHRQWGRLIGLVYGLGLLWFWLRQKIPTGYKEPLIGLLLLGGGQGAMGWLMVQSGLVDNPAVSHYRLAAHLFLAIVIFLIAIVLAMRLQVSERFLSDNDTLAPKLLRHCKSALIMVIITMVWGAFVAGLDAGLLYNTWPSMDGHIMPPDAWHLVPWWKNIFENHGMVQFTHRMLAYLSALMCLSIGVMTHIRKVPMHAAKWGFAVAAMALLQVLLGIITIITQVHLHVAVTHQAGAFILLGLLIIFIFRLKSLAPTSHH